jgi:hypothetical protein
MWPRPSLQHVPQSTFIHPDFLGHRSTPDPIGIFVQPRQCASSPPVVVVVDGQPFVQLVDRQQAREPVLESVRFLADELDLACNQRPAGFFSGRPRSRPSGAEPPSSLRRLLGIDAESDP